MKKLLTTLLLTACGLSLAAQTERGIIYPGAYYGSVDLGAAIYGRNHEVSFGVPAVGLTAGWWISTPLAFQIAADAVLAPNAADNQSLYLYTTAEFKWDVNRTFFHVYNDRFLRPLPFYPLFGLGLLWNFDMEVDSANTERSFQAMAGIQVPVRINDRMSAKLEYKCYFLPQGFDRSAGDNFMHVVRVGMLFNGHTDPFHRRTEYETRSIGEDWFIGFGIGPNYSAFDIFTNPNRGGLAMLGVAPELMFGRNFSQFWAVRFELTGLTGHEAFDTINQRPAKDYKFSFFHADLFGNLSYLFDFKRDVKWNFMPYLGAGLIWRYDDPKLDMAIDFGFFVRRYLSRHSDLFVDLKYIMMSPAMGGGHGPSGSSFGVGIPSLTFGYIYNFGHSTTRYRMPY